MGNAILAGGDGGDGLDGDTGGAATNGAQRWVNMLGSGASLEQVSAQIVASPEFIQDQGGGFSSWLSAVYRDALHRPVDPSGMAHWSSLFSSGTSREQIALYIVGCSEYFSDLVDSYYELFLGRSANNDPRSQGWVSLLEQGASNQVVIAGIMASQEFHSDSVS